MIICRNYAGGTSDVMALHRTNWSQPEKKQDDAQMDLEKMDGLGRRG
jgi:hypothetical protein